MDRFVQELSHLRRIAFVCNQWGDTGKGKFVDLAIHIFLQKLQRGRVWCFRGNGGPNAGHTVVAGGKSVILHEIPSGVLHDAEGCSSVIGPGAVVDPRITCAELDELSALGLNVRNLVISHEAPVILPHHIFLDRYAKHTREIGTTGRGIGPAYGDLIARNAILVNDLMNPSELQSKIQAKTRDLVAAVGENFDRELAHKILLDPYFGSVDFFDPDFVLDATKVFEAYRSHAAQLTPFVGNVHSLVQTIMSTNETVVLEGAQGLLLGLRHGTTKFQTSSDASAAGLILGSGFQLQDIERVYGIAKAPYMTRVGAGPFPTEMGGPCSERHCANGFTQSREQETFGSFKKPFIRSELECRSLSKTPDFMLGVDTRMVGKEYGATTGRPRRCGWLDLAALRYAVQVNGPDLILTKFDVMTGCPHILLGMGYIYCGPEMSYAGKTLKSGQQIEDFIRFSDILRFCQPIYRMMPGWEADISQCRTVSELPDECRQIVSVIEDYSQGLVRILSVGADREAIIVC